KKAKKKVFVAPKNLRKLSQANSPISPSKTEYLIVGQKVKHSRFGRGKILKIEGEDANKKATVFFDGIGQKMLLLKFAKLEIEK
ncbi:MAG: ATP-dependent DNA helicase, partial [Bacteroidota bacterium]|nr:ATP-dependent DNA helicase [Bacteroidota bacterium]